MATSGNPFDAVIAQAQGGQSAPAPSNSQPTAQPSPQPAPSDGNPFTSIVQQAIAAPQQQSSNDGFWSGVYQNTLGPIVQLGKELADYQQKKSLAQKALEAVGGPLVMLADAASDPSHPLHKLGAGVVQGALDQAHQAYAYSGDAATASKMALQALMKGNVHEAAAEGSSALSSASQGYGHFLAAQLPGIGPAAAQAGDDLGSGNTAKGAGEAAGLVTSVLAPGVITRGVGAVSGAADALRGAADTAAPAEALRTSLRDTAADVAETQGVEVPESLSVRDAFNDSSQALFSKGKSLYQAVDNATNGRWQINENALKAVNRGIRTATDDEQLSELFGRQQELLDEQDQVLKEAEANGVDPDTVAQAKATWRQASALDDLQGQIQMATDGRAGVTADEVVQPKKLLPRLVKMYDSGRLEEALGSDENAKAIIREVEQAGDSIEAAQALTARLKATGIAAAKIMGAGLLGGAAWHVGSAALGGH